MLVSQSTYDCQKGREFTAEELMSGATRELVCRMEEYWKKLILFWVIFKREWVDWLAWSVHDVA